MSKTSMALPETNQEKKEKPFQGKVVYFSASIRGALHPNPEVGYEIARLMVEGGAEVLDVVASGRNPEERIKIFIQENGFDPNGDKDSWLKIEEMDVQMVDRSTHMVAIVDGPSHGVGNEIQRAVDNFEFGKRRTEILCLIQENGLESLSWMLRGKLRYPNFQLKTYKDVEDAKRIVAGFLTQK